ncbi:MAG TPA: hypothetical protein VM537_02380 [Anaerolineae bacterium]|nr:hypothetical protein [Anaerolineae bacterium]
MSNWKVIASERTVNYVLNPSIGLATNYVAIATAVVTRKVAGGAAVGLGYLNLDCLADNDGVTFTLAPILGACYVTMLVRDNEDTDPLAGNWDWQIDATTIVEPAVIMTMGGPATDRWVLWGAWMADAGAADTFLHIRQRGANDIDFDIGYVQVECEGATHWTTFCDGDQPGCVWDGTPHASSSRRSAFTRRGGMVNDLEDFYSFQVGGMVGPGSGIHTISVNPYALSAGGEINNDKLESGMFNIIGSIKGTSWSNYHSLRSELIAALSSRGWPNDERGPQPVRLWYTGTNRVKYVDAFFNGGLELALRAESDGCYFEKNIALQFITPDPVWREVTATSFPLDVEDALAVKGIVGKQFATRAAYTDAYGVWGNLGVAALSGNDDVFAIAVGPDGKVYVGGDFTDMDADAGIDYIGVYDPIAGTWASVGGADIDGPVYALAFDANGLLWIGGNFTDVGDGDGDNLVTWDGTSLASVGTASSRGIVYTITIDQSGNVIVGGNFTAWDGTAANYAVKWNGAAWVVLQAGQLNGIVRASALSPNGDVYLGGAFTGHPTAGQANYVCRYDGTEYKELGGSANNGVNGNVLAIAIDRSGRAVIGGAFTTARGATANYIVMWHGSGFVSLGSGLGGQVNALAFAKDGALWVGGAFTSMADLGWVAGLAIWKNDSWSVPDIDLIDAVVHAITIGRVDPIVTRNYDVWVGIDKEVTASCAGVANVQTTRLGTWLTHPSIHISRSGGTSARAISIKNTATGHEICMDYALQDGETLSLYLDPSRKMVVSNFYGDRPDAILPSSDFGSWMLSSRSYGGVGVEYNTLTAFLETAGAPTITAWIEYNLAYEGVDSE